LLRFFNDVEPYINCCLIDFHRSNFIGQANSSKFDCVHTLFEYTNLMDNQVIHCPKNFEFVVAVTYSFDL